MTLQDGLAPGSAQRVWGTEGLSGPHPWCHLSLSLHVVPSPKATFVTFLLLCLFVFKERDIEGELHLFLEGLGLRLALS